MIFRCQLSIQNFQITELKLSLDYKSTDHFAIARQIILLVRAKMKYLPTLKNVSICRRIQTKLPSTGGNGVKGYNFTFRIYLPQT